MAPGTEGRGEGDVLRGRLVTVTVGFAKAYGAEDEDEVDADVEEEEEGLEEESLGGFCWMRVMNSAGTILAWF